MAKKANGLDDLIDSGLLAPATAEQFTIRRVSSGVPAIDAILGGGFAYGRNVMIVGPESTGKTVLAQFAAAAIQADNPKGKVLLIDAEMSFDRDWWAKSGVDLTRLWVLQPPTGETAVDAIIKAVQDPLFKGIILDSIASLAPTAIIEKEAGERTVASLSTLCANLYTRLMPANRSAVFIAINQLRDNMNGYDDVYPGGRVVRHDSHIILRTRRDGWIKDGDAIVGYVMEVLAKKNKLGEPMGETRIPFLYSSQIDMLINVIDQAIERGLIEQRGPWYYKGAERWMGKTNLRQHYRENPEAFAELERALMP